jgi:MoaA/NifB/PqqE/SkfB family radical SAM enzyme
MPALNDGPFSQARQLVGLVRTHLGTVVKRKPQLIPKLAVNYARMNFMDQDVLRTASVNIESACNATCDHCSADDIMGETTRNENQLSLDEYRRAIDGFLRAGAVSVNLTGGEPLLNPNVYDIIKMVPPWRGVVNIQTNGLLLDDATARKLREAGLYIVMISLHSHRPEEHDALLNVPGAYDKVMEAIDNCHRHGMDVILNCTMTHEKVQDGTLWEMVRLARDKNVTVNFVQPCTTGKWADNKGIRMQPDDYEENGCRPGLERMYMSNAGDVIPCAFIHLNFGNVRKESVGTIWERMKSFEYFQETKERCIASNDETFYNEYIEPIMAHENALFPIEEHPKYQQTNPDEARTVIR